MDFEIYQWQIFGRLLKSINWTNILSRLLPLLSLLDGIRMISIEGFGSVRVLLLPLCNQYFDCTIVLRVINHMTCMAQVSGSNLCSEMCKDCSRLHITP